MPRELITIQVGQCGNQIGTRFWDLALKEHSSYNSSGIFDEAMSSFFRNVESKNDESTEIPVGDGKGKIKNLKARAILIDMEEGVVNEILKDKQFADLFDSRQNITDTSGAGNNWAHGHEEYGPKYHEDILEKIRRSVEGCDSLQSFIVLHSLGGGTGSGVGTYILELLQDNFPEVYRFDTPVFPSEDDDVITSPYNSLLAISKLIDHADCVLPIDNQSLMEISDKIQGTSRYQKSDQKEEVASFVKTKKGKPFDTMNNIAAHMLLNLTCSMRFGGSLNIDLNEITMNLVPYPKMHFLLSSLTPLYGLGNPKIQPRSLDQMFSDAFSKDYQLIRSDPKHNKYLACALMVRGADVEISDLRRNIERIRPQLQFVRWNQEGWKVGLCFAPPLQQKHSLLCLSNNCSIKNIFENVCSRFSKLYRTKAYAHHYNDFGVDDEYFKGSLETVKQLITDYNMIDGVEDTNTETTKRLIPVQL